VWIFDVGKRLTVKSELHQEINRRFREANIEIAFPQQDIHFDPDAQLQLHVTSDNRETAETGLQKGSGTDQKNNPRSA
ncbi:MAG: hypothetical protein JRJ85_00775, partial [Deltaproteobacteria bacterium]|nr:hypothetical protein [Deltaproteobacteria bacterium]